MLKPVIAATALLAIGGSSLLYAQQRFGGPSDFGDRGPGAEARHHLSADDIAAFTDARIAALKAGLQLTPDQQKNWPPFEQALRDMAQLRIERMHAREAAAQQGERPITPFDRLARRADDMAKTSTALKRVADAGAPLYQGLNDAQKNRFRMLARMLRPHWRRAEFREWRERHGERQGFEHHARQFGDGDRPAPEQFDRLMGDDAGGGSQL